MYLDPSVSINCKYKLDKIFDLISSFNMVSEVKESSDYFGQFSTCFMNIIEQFQQVMHLLWKFGLL